MLNGRSAGEDLCLKPVNQRDVIVKRSPLKKLMSLSLRRIREVTWFQTVGELVLVGEAGELALEVTSHRKCQQRKFIKAIT